MFLHLWHNIAKTSNWELVPLLLSFLPCTTIHLRTLSKIQRVETIFYSSIFSEVKSQSKHRLTGITLNQIDNPRNSFQLPVLVPNFFSVLKNWHFIYLFIYFCSYTIQQGHTYSFAFCSTWILKHFRKVTFFLMQLSMTQFSIKSDSVIRRQWSSKRLELAFSYMLWEGKQ